ncbi:hypothetical protein GCM10007216_21580 [Thalassobacillus devorans]|uniref:Transposase IS200-like domain-containing protein n=1 Tax=Thalassobacillus devorans TaxID=279813 RepID=A0ABQ1P3L1_9BACI|nr:hypothetical protein GCM10007216_21580 [Thalassobacillus devorans]
MEEKRGKSFLNRRDGSYEIYDRFMFNLKKIVHEDAMHDLKHEINVFYTCHKDRCHLILQSMSHP